MHTEEDHSLMFRTIPVLALLTLTLTTGIHAQGDDTPWTVFADEATAHTGPNFDSAEVAQFHEGDAVSGEFFVNTETDEEWLVIDADGQTAHLTLTALNRVHPDNIRDGSIPFGEEVVDRWWGLPLDYEPSDLVQIPARYTVDSDRVYQLRREACDQLIAMFREALEDGVDIQVASAYRSGERQRQIYQRNVARRGASQRSSARPGHSEHQLGTTVDLSDPAGEWAFSQEFGDSPQGQWLTENAARFGFRQTYRPDNVEQTGYIIEPWHWRYMGVDSGSSQ